MPEQIPLMVDAATQELRQFASDETIPQGQLLAALQVALTGLDTSNVSGVLDSDTILQAIGKLQAQAQALDANTGFTIIYPNGGSAAAPATVDIDSRYVMPNPFPGFQVVCVAELFSNGTWGETGWAYFSGGYGTKASQSSAEGIVVQTGTIALTAIGTHAGGIFPYQVTTPTPCRVKVWKLKGGV
ncbi:hypothetical protein [Comamonas jiangduensis]|uniref:hypothetical protein n=1 Tax=Comamonas jiangduensis TaxID=1194168 RepID=UPI003BF817D1